MATLRGFAAGSEVGDTLAAGSVELLLPITSPLSFGKLGVSAFFDAGAVYDKGEHMVDQRFSRGAGGAVWFSAAFVRAYLAVAHGLGGSTRDALRHDAGVLNAQVFMAQGSSRPRP